MSTITDGSGNGIIYVLKASERKSPIKIGVTAQLTARLSAHQSGSPLPLEIAEAIVCAELREAHRIERAAHAVLRIHRIWGEWFAIDAAMALRTIEHVAIAKGFVWSRFTEKLPIKSGARMILRPRKSLFDL
jgi:predicted GIY-YIG superfamily endonuclease